jgi:hypothetical protein
MRKREFFQFKCGTKTALQKLDGVFDELQVFENKIKDYGENAAKFGNPELIQKAIKDIANKNIQKITEWTNAHPSCKSNYSKTNDKYMKILNESMCSDTKEEENDKYNKIIKNIAKEVIIDKT